MNIRPVTQKGYLNRFLSYLKPSNSIKLLAILIIAGISGSAGITECPQLSRAFNVTGVGPASYLKNSTTDMRIREIAEESAPKFIDVPGIIKSSGHLCGFWGRCQNYVSDVTGVDVSLEPRHLIKNGYKPVSNPEIFDIVLYFQTPFDTTACFDGNCLKRNEGYTHIGIVSAVKDGIVWVKSKWGRLPCYEHLEEAVPDAYGNAIMYFRKK